MKISGALSPLLVSTHSRPKAAGVLRQTKFLLFYSFNTQPPEGGWLLAALDKPTIQSFNTQPPEGGWPDDSSIPFPVSSFNTQPPEGGWTKERCQAE